MLGRKMGSKGFTLIELIVVVIVIGVLATIAVPQYMSAVERAKGGKAKNALGLISRAEKMYKAQNDVYVVFAAASPGNANATLGTFIELTEVDNDSDWTYGVTSTDTSANFTATATRGAGTYKTKTITLTQSGVLGGTFPF
jgi:prepilin-type N-terminal cleavage/methylation domain-containing protein